jgi:hypothetical protein
MYHTRKPKPTVIALKREVRKNSNSKGKCDEAVPVIPKINQSINRGRAGGNTK